MMVIQIANLPVAVAVAVLSVLVKFDYYSQKDGNMDHYKTTSLLHLQSLKQKEAENFTEKLQPQSEKLEDRPSHEDLLMAFIGSMPLDVAVFILLIDSCGENLVASISTVWHHRDLLNFVFTVYLWYRHKAKIAELEKKNTHLQKDSARNKEDREDVVSTLMEVKTELENQRAGLKQLLEEVEREREANKQKIQAVEKEIMGRGMVFDKPEELLREKENLLRAQWKLEQEQKYHEKQLLDIEKPHEPIEIQVTRGQRNEEAVQVNLSEDRKKAASSTDRMSTVGYLFVTCLLLLWIIGWIWIILGNCILFYFLSST